MARYVQVKKLATIDQFNEQLQSVGVSLPSTRSVQPAGPLSTATSFTDRSAGRFEIPNRLAILPMEGWDASGSGRPTDLVRRRWARFGASGAGLIWGEATAVRLDGRANPNQLVLDEQGASGLAELRSLLTPDQVVGIQLTHSGRFARPGQSAAPRTAYQHPVLDARLGIGAAAVLSDAELDQLVEDYVAASVRAHDAGFDFVDIKHCHGYLLHELLSGYERPGPYGGSLFGRTHFLRQVVNGIRSAAPSLAVAVRLSLYDLVPFAAGPGGAGVPDAPPRYRNAFGGDAETGRSVDLTEPSALLSVFEELGIGLVCATAGSPYYNPHIQRPAYFPPSDGYRPPEDPLVGVARMIGATAELARAHPTLTMVGSGYSYLQDWLGHVGEGVIESGGADLIGLGRMALSYPNLPRALLQGAELERGLICRTFSDCTTAPRSGLVSGCFPIDPFYKSHPDRAALTIAKRAAKQRLSAE